MMRVALALLNKELEDIVILAIVLFAIAAVGGVTLAFLRLKERPLPMPLALVHGAIAAAGLIALIIGVASGAGGSAVVALILFLVAALGGFLLFSFHLRKKQLPIGVMGVHGIVAVAAFLVLLIGVAVTG